LMVQALKTASDCSSCPVLLACAGPHKLKQQLDGQKPLLAWLHRR
jgi:hypothetical protein